MFRKPWATLLTIGVMAVALALPLGLWVVLGNVQRFASDVQTSRQISMYLKDGTDAARANALAGELRKRLDIASVEMRTPEQGLETLRAQDGLGDAIDALAATGDDASPLPWLLLVTPGGDDLTLAESLRTLPEADLVQHDAVWRSRAGQLAALRRARRIGARGPARSRGIARRRQHPCARHPVAARGNRRALLGATDGFIRRPFLYLGVWYGLASARSRSRC